MDCFSSFYWCVCVYVDKSVHQIRRKFIYEKSFITLLLAVTAHPNHPTKNKQLTLNIHQSQFFPFSVLLRFINFIRVTTLLMLML